MRRYGVLVTGFSVLLFCACLQAEPTNIGLLRTELRRYYESGQYLKEVTAQIALAASAIPLRHKAKKPAVVFDIDETLLSNYGLNDKKDFSPTKKEIDVFMASAQAPALSPVQRLYQRAQKAHVAIFLITGRPEGFRTATILNLHHAGYRGWKKLFMLPFTEKLKSVAGYKAAQRAANAAGVW